MAFSGNLQYTKGFLYEIFGSDPEKNQLNYSFRQKSQVFL